MLADPLSRRTFLAVSSTALGAAWLAADPALVRAALDHAARAARSPLSPGSPDPVPWDVLTPDQAADLDAIAAQIFPTDDTPGAREARVVTFLDRSLGTWAAQQREPLLHGLDELNGEVERRWPGTQRFANLAPERQLELLRAQEQTPFFQQMRFATLVGMFSLPPYGGNADKAGCVVGSGAAGGIIAKELATAGLTVVVLEQGPRVEPPQFEHDEIKTLFQSALQNNPAGFTFRRTASETAKPGQIQLLYHRLVGGGSVMFTANYWRFREIDFIEKSRLGAISGTG
ncbi:MAG: hypothetical protein E6K06_08890, partial [Methanobacteriota archaeon]